MARYVIKGTTRYAPQDNEIGRMLGRVGTKWDDGGVMPVELIAVGKEGDLKWEVPIRVWVQPKVDTGRKSSRHRAMCACPGCHGIYSVGRIAQHVCKAGAK